MSKLSKRVVQGEIALKVKPLKVAVGVQCNRCGRMLYQEVGNLSPEEISRTLKASSEVWRDYGSAKHPCL